MRHPALAALALPAALLLPAAIAAPTEAVGAVTAHHSPHWWHCNTRARPCDPKPKPAPKKPAVSARAKVLKVAASLRGVPYRYGGMTPKGFDCSGYTQYVFRKATGKRLPRTAAAQYRAARHVRSPRPGDLVFWLSQGRAYHAGIFAGHGKLWAARKTGTTVGIQGIWGHPVFGSYLA